VVTVYAIRTLQRTKVSNLLEGLEPWLLGLHIAGKGVLKAPEGHWNPEDSEARSRSRRNTSNPLELWRAHRAPQSLRGLLQYYSFFVLVIEGSGILPEPSTAYNRPSPLLYLALIRKKQL